MTVVYSLYAHSDTVSIPGCYRGKMSSITGPFPPPDNFAHLLEPFTDPEGLVCWTGKVKWGFLIALLFLQVLTLVWFSMIVKVAVNVLKGGQADDTRSDNKGEDELEKEKKPGTTGRLDEPEELQPFEEEVGVEFLNLKGRRSHESPNRYRKRVNRASGISLPDRKELLGRIGCDKEIKD
jgi:acyl-CoA-dependent ceramide synthase